MKTEDKLFRFRIIETTYRNYLAYDEESGSATSVESISSTQVLREWSTTESWAKEIIEKGDPWLRRQSSSQDGRYDFSYTLEKTEVGKSDWKYYGHIPQYAHIDCRCCGALLPYPGADCLRCRDWM
jgi:hypothetical protein